MLSGCIVGDGVDRASFFCRPKAEGLWCYLEASERCKKGFPKCKKRKKEERTKERKKEIKKERECVFSQDSRHGGGVEGRKENHH